MTNPSTRLATIRLIHSLRPYLSNNELFINVRFLVLFQVNTTEINIYIQSNYLVVPVCHLLSYLLDYITVLGEHATLCKLHNGTIGGLLCMKTISISVSLLREKSGLSCNTA